MTAARTPLPSTRSMRCVRRSSASTWPGATLWNTSSNPHGKRVLLHNHRRARNWQGLQRHSERHRLGRRHRDEGAAESSDKETNYERPDGTSLPSAASVPVAPRPRSSTPRRMRPRRTPTRRRTTSGQMANHDCRQTAFQSPRGDLPTQLHRKRPSTINIKFVANPEQKTPCYSELRVAPEAPSAADDAPAHPKANRERMT